jgi:hypothetical protein
MANISSAVSVRYTPTPSDRLTVALFYVQAQKFGEPASRCQGEVVPG